MLVRSDLVNVPVDPVHVIDQEEAVAPVLLPQDPPPDGPGPARPGVEAELADPLQAGDVGHLDADDEVLAAREAQVGEAEAEVFAEGEPDLLVEVAPRGGQFQGPGIGGEPEVRVASRVRLAGPGEPMGQADPPPLDVEQGAGDAPREVELQGPRQDHGRRVDRPDELAGLLGAGRPERDGPARRRPPPDP